jgi:hypothetical protein
MPEVDHTVTPPLEPAKPILSSQLLELELKQRQRFSGRGERISTGCKEIDDYVLGGDGLERGIVVGISGESSEGRLVSDINCFFFCPTILLFWDDRRHRHGRNRRHSAIVGMLCVGCIDAEA